MKNNNYIFLDFDGVLNSTDFVCRNNKYEHLTRREVHDNLQPDLVENLNVLVEETNSHVVVSSTWRILNDLSQLQQILNRAGFKHKLLGVTPGGGGFRGIQIQDYIDSLDTEPDRILIIDDSSDMGHLMPYLLRTTMQNGFNVERLAYARVLFNANLYTATPIEWQYDAYKDWHRESSFRRARWNQEYTEDTI